MAITVSTILAGMRAPEMLDKASFTAEAAGHWASLFAIAGAPGQGAVGAPGLAGVALSSPLNGCFTITNPTAPSRQYLAGVSLLVAGNATAIRIVDRLWHNSGIAVTTTTAQAINSVAFPARDEDGTVNGRNVVVGIEVVTATTNAGVIANTTMSYTNELGVAGRTATMPAFPATAVAGTFVPFVLASNDRGVRSIQSITLGTSYGGGAISLVAIRQIYLGGDPVGTGQLAHTADFAKTRLPRVFDSSCLYACLFSSGTAIGRAYGNISLTHVDPT